MSGGLHRLSAATLNLKPARNPAVMGTGAAMVFAKAVGSVVTFGGCAWRRGICANGTVNLMASPVSIIVAGIVARRVMGVVPVIVFG